jgi:hypothetical protein
MYMGGADADDDHYLPFKAHFQANPVDINFPPYWFFMYAEGRDMLNEILSAQKTVGVHMPVKVPKYSVERDYLYFSEQGSSIQIERYQVH